MKKQIVRETHDPQENTLLLTIAEACTLLRIRSPKCIYDMFTSGQLPTVVIGHRRFVKRESVDEVIRNGEQEAYTAIRRSPRRKAA